ncbi:MAG: VWA domain-containing protein [Ruminococcus sp.]
MRKIIAYLTSILLTATFLFSAYGIPVSAQQVTSNRFNVVFVLDASGSIKSTDPNNYRFEATTYFLGLLANEGNYVGNVVFSTDIIKTTDINAINGQSDKDKIERDIESCSVGGWTAIGTALNKGVTMLNEKGNKSLPSVMILLSDGKSELDSDDALRKCNELKAKAINNARKKGIKIYTVGLNSDGGADMEELKQISDATSGKCEEVKNANDLKKVFDRFYNLIYDTSTTQIGSGNIPSNGKIQQKFSVPNAGVEEVNIIVSSSDKVDNLTLTKPDGTTMSADEVKKITTESKTFSITKISNPQGGEWTLNARGKAGARFTIEMVYNDCLSVSAEYDESKKYRIGDSATIRGYIYNNDEKAVSGYEDFEATLTVIKQTTDNEKDGDENKYIMEAKDGSYEYDVYFDEQGSYSMYIEVDGNGITKSTEHPVVINVDNSVPKVKKKQIDEHFWVFPFITNSGDIDISGAVVDKEDKELKYTVDSSAFKEKSYELNGTTLTITDFNDLSEGSFTIRATDSNGASAKFEVNVTTTNVGIVALIVIGAIILIILLVFGTFTYILLNKRFMGDCYVSTFNHETGEYTEEVKRTKGRGRIRLSAFGLTAPGFDMSKCYLQATGKDYIEFHSPKPVCGAGMKSKKIRVSGMEVQITQPTNSSAGISVRFDSRKNKNNGWF